MGYAIKLGDYYLLDETGKEYAIFATEKAAEYEAALYPEFEAKVIKLP